MVSGYCSGCYGKITMNNFCSSIDVLDGNDMNFGGFVGITDEQFNIILQTPGLADALKGIYVTYSTYIYMLMSSSNDI